MADLSGAPPPRFRVVERGRRLVVIDHASPGSPATPPLPARNGPPLPLATRRVRFDGSAELTTHPFYDAHGPRTIRLDPGSAAMLGRMKLAGMAAAMAAMLLVIAAPGTLILLGFALSHGPVRRLPRRIATRWLDRIAREAG